MIEREILVDSIRTDRRRRVLGDVEALAKSIADVGLIFPIVVSRDVQLVLGLRRLAAVKLLGWPMVPAIAADDLDAVIERIRVERDDDTEFKPMLRSEMVALGQTLEWVDGPRRHQRRVVASRAAGSGTRTAQAGTSERTNHKIAAALEVGYPTFGRAKHVVVTAATHSDPVVRAFAREQLDVMDRTGSVNGPYRRVRALTRLPEGSHTVSSPPMTGAAAQRKAINAALLSLTGLTDGLARINDIDERITVDEAAQWVDGLAESRRIIERTINRLRQHATKGQVT